MSNPPLNTIYATSEPNQGGSVTRLVDVTRIEHLAYPTARRTLCLERFVNQCSTTRPANGTCPTCTHVLKQMKRARSKETPKTHDLGAAERVRLALAVRRRPLSLLGGTRAR